MIDPIQSFLAQMPMIITLVLILFEMIYWALVIVMTIWMVRDGSRRGINWMGFWATAFILASIPNMFLPFLPLLPAAVLIAYLFVRARFVPDEIAMNTAGNSSPVHLPGNSGVQSRSIDPGETIKVRIKNWAEDAWLVKKSDPAINQKIPIDQNATIIGRHPENTVAFLADTDGDVSRQHAKIEHIANNYILTDLGSSNGTFVASNGGTESQLTGDSQHVLQNGDIVKFGTHTKVEFNRAN